MALANSTPSHSSSCSGQRARGITPLLDHGIILTSMYASEKCSTLLDTHKFTLHSIQPTFCTGNQRVGGSFQVGSGSSRRCSCPPHINTWLQYLIIRRELHEPPIQRDSVRGSVRLRRELSWQKSAEKFSDSRRVINTGLRADATKPLPSRYDYMEASQSSRNHVQRYVFIVDIGL